MAKHLPWSQKLPPGCDPLTSFILTKLGEPALARLVACWAGLAYDGIRMWLYRYPSEGPPIKRLLRALDQMGYEVRIVKVRDVELTAMDLYKAHQLKQQQTRQHPAN